MRALRPDDVTVGFDSGSSALDGWLARFARANQAAGAAQVYVVTDGARVVGYFALAAGSVAWDESPARVRKGLARHPVPVVVLARLAVDRSVQGRGLGAYLLRDALARVAGAAETIGVRAVLVNAKDEPVAGFYRRFGFEPSPLDPHQLLVLVKDVRRAIGRSDAPGPS